MKSLRTAIAGLTLLGVPIAAAAQSASAQPLRSTPVMTQALEDSAFVGVVVNSSVLELVPGAEVTEAHTHDAELFGYILEGAVLTSLENAPIQRYEAGEMFYERRRILHTHFANASSESPARVLIVQIATPDDPVP
ncbi:MAG: cupin domain-containing protein [Gemmatimonas sp.]|nr:cupin domain-containing protein [Gemmatimonas sp.]